MSTVEVTALKHESAVVDNITLNSDGTSTLAGNLVFSDASVQTTAPIGGINFGTVVATTSGTSIDFTGVPAGVKKITVMFNEVSTNGTSIIQIQIGTSGGIQTSGYQGVGFTTNTTMTAMSGGFLLSGVWAAAYSKSGIATLSILDSSDGTWTFNSVTSLETASTQVGVAQDTGSGIKLLSGTLDRVRITTAGGANTFDAGSVNISWEF